LGSYRNPAPVGSSSASFASIGSIGGEIGKRCGRDGQCIPSTVVALLTDKGTFFHYNAGSMSISRLLVRHVSKEP
jgi:hypothetical protein